MTDREIIDFAASLYDQLAIRYARSESTKRAPRRKVWTIAVQSRLDLIRLADLVPIAHSAKREKLAAILASYTTTRPYRRAQRAADLA